MDIKDLKTFLVLRMFKFSRFWLHFLIFSHIRCYLYESKLLSIISIITQAIINNLSLE